MSRKREKLKSLLKELFQLDQPDLDFGFYRVMHAKSAEVTQFLDHDLLPQVMEAFKQYQPADKAAIERELAQVTAGVQAAGLNPDDAPKVKELRARLAEEAVDLDALEAEVYDHLYSFFRRYYSEGDFLSKRVYKPGVYAIPYEGEEVKLYWANADQYYIKTSEYLRNYAFRLRPDDEKNPMRARFRLADATEGEHGNAKELSGKERRFKPAAPPFATIEDGELVIRFTYQPDAENRKQKELNAAAEKAILSLTDASLADWIRLLGEKHMRADGTVSDATRLRVHLDRYTARNTFDYFIHKDLGGFLRRELDFYIKNEVMRLDDIENETAPRVEQYLSKIKVIRRIAHKIIDFLAQLEDFQKKLWLKKKFVAETSYSIRLGVIPEAFHEAIAANEMQRKEWVRLCAIDELKPTQGSLIESSAPGYSAPLTVEFLKTHPTLMVDTRHFDEAFTARLLDAINNLDDQTDGVLFHTENFQALSLMQEKYREQVKCIYIDPPYNTEKDRENGKFVYKDTYESSSWLTMMEGRVVLARNLLNSRGGQYVSIDDVMYADLIQLLAGVFGKENHIATVIWEKVHTRKNSARHYSVSHDYIPCFAKDNHVWERVLIPRENQNAYSNPDNDPRGPWKADPIYANNPYEADYVIKKPNGVVLNRPAGRYWRFSEATWLKLVNDRAVIWGEGAGYPLVKRYLADVQDGLVPVTLFTRSFAGDNAVANSEFDALFGSARLFSYPKPSLFVVRLLQTNLQRLGAEIALDFFAGSGTTGHAVINLNREDGGRRKFILVEMADYFDTVLLPRLKKVTFTPEWKDGKPKRLATAEEAERSPRILKIVRLESYEDTLNNLELRRAEAQQSLLDLAEAQGADRLKEQYILRYMLDVETRGSRSLLNLAAFTDPTAYKLKVKRPGSDESREATVDLLETFNWLIGLAVERIAAPQAFQAEFERDDEGRLQIKGRLKPEAAGRWWFRAVIGATRDGRKTLVIWRNRPGGETPEGVEQDNLVLDEWFTKQGYSSRDSEFDLIYVNGGNNLENLKTPDDAWKVRLIEEDFFRLMFDTEGV